MVAEPLMVRRVTEVRLATPFSVMDLQQYLLTVRDELGQDAEVEAMISWPENELNRAQVTLVATQTDEVEGYNPRPQAGEAS